MAYQVDWEAGVITVPQSDLVYLSVGKYKLDLFDFLKRCWDLSDEPLEGLSYPEIATYYPTIDTGDVILGKTILINYWDYSVVFDSGVGGFDYAVLFDGANTNVHNYTAVNGVSIRPNNSAGLQDLSTLLAMAYMDRVVVDVIKGQGGTVVPIGTLGHPSGNIPQAVEIAEKNGLSTLMTIKDLTLGVGDDVSYLELRGIDAGMTVLTIETEALCVETRFRDLFILGVFDGNSSVDDCITGDIQYFSGTISNSSLTGRITSSGTEPINIHNCRVGDYNNLPVIDLIGGNQDLIITEWTGDLTIESSTNADSKIGIGMLGGTITIHPSCTEGTFVVSGDGQVINNGGANVVLDVTGLNNPKAIADATWEHDTGKHIVQSIWVDTELIIDGDGSQKSPFNNVNSAKDYAEANGIKDIYLSGDIIIPSSIKNMNVHGIGLPRIDLNGHEIKNSKFHHCSLSGTYTNEIIAEECHLENNFLIAGHFNTCEIMDRVVAGSTTEAVLVDCIGGTHIEVSTLSMNSGVGTTVKAIGMKGVFKIVDADHVDDNVLFVMDGGRLTLDPSCTNGDITPSGTCKFIDNSNGSHVTNETTTETIMRYTRP